MNLIRLRKRSRQIYCILFLYSIAVLLIPSYIINFFPKPLGAQCMYLMLNGIYHDHAAVRCACWLLVLILICIIWVPLLKKRCFAKSFSCMILAAYCLFDCVISVVFPSSVPIPVLFEGRKSLIILYAAIEILGDLLLSVCAMLQISNGAETANTNEDDPSDLRRRT